MKKYLLRMFERVETKGRTVFQRNHYFEVELDENLDSWGKYHFAKEKYPNLTDNEINIKFEEITNRLDYKFKTLENYVRSVEASNLDENTMSVLGNYHYILDAKKELIRLQKRIISVVKAKEGVDYSFIHNNPKLDNLLNIKGAYYLTSIENGKIGIYSLE